MGLKILGICTKGGHTFFSGKKNIILCILKGISPFKMHKIIDISHFKMHKIIVFPQKTSKKKIKVSPVNLGRLP